MSKTICIYHSADFDGIFSREIVKQAHPDAEFIGWNYGDPIPKIPIGSNLIMVDISIDPLMTWPGLTWIDHNKSAMEKWAGVEIFGYRIDGVAACRLAWQWFNLPVEMRVNGMPGIEAYQQRLVGEPFAVTLAGEYDIWDKRDPRAELFQHGLRSRDLDDLWPHLLSPFGGKTVQELLDGGRVLQYARTKENASIIKALGFTVEFEGLTFLACNAARFNSHLFTAGLTPEHDGCLGFAWDGSKDMWKVSMYGVPGKPDIDFSAIAAKYKGGGHKQACGFTSKYLPFSPGHGPHAYLANDLLFTDPENSEELRPTGLPTQNKAQPGTYSFVVENEDGRRKWKHTITTEEV